MSKQRICVVVTARPSYSRLKTLIQSLLKRDDVDTQVVVGCSALLERYGNVSQIMRAEGIPIAAEVWSTVEGENLLTSALGTSLGMAEFANVFKRLSPDMVCIHADRHELLGAASAARLLEIGICHLQAGEVTGSVDDDVRNAITQLADVHLVSTAAAAKRVATMRGRLGGGLYITGCPSIDLCVGLETEPPVTAQELGGAGAPIDLEQPFVVVLQHPTTDRYEYAYNETKATLDACLETGVQTLVFWPGNEAGSDGASKAIRLAQDRVHTVRNLPPRRFLRLLTQSASLVGNSSVGIRECSYLGVPVVNIGSRQRGRERGCNVVDVGRGSLRAAIERGLAAGFYPSSTLYGDGAAGQRMADVLVEVARERTETRRVDLPRVRA